MRAKTYNSGFTVNIWPGYVDILSFTLLIFLFVFVIAFARYQYLAYLIGKGEQELQTIMSLFDDEAFKMEEDGKIIIQSKVLFASDQHNLTTLGRETLLRIGEKLRSYLETDLKRKFTIIVEGHTDTKADYKHNMELSLRRATEVTNLWQKELGFGTEQDAVLDLFPSGYGETRLLVPTPDNTEEEANRRIEIRIVPKFREMLEGWIFEKGK